MGLIALKIRILPMHTPAHFADPVQAPAFALVTGGARRLGREIALTLARAGWSIVLHYRTSVTEAEKTALEIRALGVACVTCQADLSLACDLQRLFDTAVQAGPVRCLVNNASLFEFDSGSSFDSVLFQRHMDCNVAAPVQLARWLHAHVPQDQQAVVVNLLDQKLHNLNPDFLSYTLSKSALNTATVLLATEFAPRLRVVGLAPGLTMISHLQTQEQFDQARQISPLNRSSQPADIGQAVLFLVQSQAITGTTLVVDGGQHLVPMARDFSMMSHHE